MTSSVMTRTRQPGMATGMGTSTVALRLISPQKTSSTCSLAVVSHLVSTLHPPPQPGLPGGDGGRLDASLSLFLQPHPLTQSLWPPGNVHVYSNGRMRYTYQQRQDRRENQGDVSEEGTGESRGRVPSPAQGAGPEEGVTSPAVCPGTGSAPTVPGQGAILAPPCHSTERH